MQGVVDSQLQHDAIIAAIQRAGGITAIYDQLQVNQKGWIRALLLLVVALVIDLNGKGNP